MTETKPKRRWFRFSLRTLFVLVTIICLCAGWVAYQLNWIRERHGIFERYGSWKTLYGIPGPHNFPWSLRLFGEKPVAGLSVRKDRIDEATRLFPEAMVTYDRFPNAR